MRFSGAYGGFLYARVNTVARFCLDEFDDPHTVWISLKASEKAPDGRWYHPLRHDDGFRSDAVRAALHRATPKAENYAGLWVHAPRRTWYSHRHYALWIDGAARASDFEKVIDSHVRNHPTATREGHPYEKAIRLRSGNELVRATAPRGNHEMDESHGATTTLTTEVGNNVPELGTDPDVRSGRSCDFWWAAMMWADDRIRYSPLGRFQEVAELARDNS
uniref:hypothetical protein n=1 Tax=Haladaptatus sp. DJG-WS-42 TaxID=3120516 RepID=UPI00403F4504